jgi:ribonuclease PH
MCCAWRPQEPVLPWLKGQGRASWREWHAAARDEQAHAARASAGKQSVAQRIHACRPLASRHGLTALGEKQIVVDCDVLQADGGTRTASITGAWVALHDAVAWMQARNMIKAKVLRDHVAAVSCGLYGGEAVLDLDYAEDSEADADANFVMTGSGGIVEVQGYGRTEPFSQEQFDKLMVLASAGAHCRVGRVAEAHRRLSMTESSKRGDKIVIATHNQGKVRELGELFAPRGIDCISAGSLGLPRPEERTGDSFAAATKLKAEAAAGAPGIPAVADDSGLEVTALGGAPGIHLARWVALQKDFGLAATRQRSLKQAAPDATAAPTSPALSLARQPLTRTGCVFGTLVWPARGAAVLVGDPIFVPAGYSETFGEMDPAKKNALSHRMRAFEKLIVGL